MRTIERKIKETVSPEMLEQAKSLRHLATLIESGKAVAVAYAWVEDEDGSNVSVSTFCGDYGKMTLMGEVTMLQAKLIRSIEDSD